MHTRHQWPSDYLTKDEDEAEEQDMLIQIDEEVYAKIMHWIEKAPGEVSGLGKVQLVDGIFMVTSAILLKQENSSVTTDIDAAAVGKAMFELKDDPGHLNWWWHSHVNMGVFWSGTDISTIKEIGANGWCLATVFNKREEMRSAYFQKGGDFMPEVFVDDIKTVHCYVPSEDDLEEWDAEYEEKCKHKSWTYTGDKRAASNMGHHYQPTTKTYSEGEEFDPEPTYRENYKPVTPPGGDFPEFPDSDIESERREMLRGGLRSEADLSEEEVVNGYDDDYDKDDDEIADMIGFDQEDNVMDVVRMMEGDFDRGLIEQNMSTHHRRRQ